ncbi:uncharacterized protein TNCV_3967041 [Trichonephila clavipes]|nr:uncharacterized protein TNCV_3967041 [Trichonephila clavipes]
MCLAQIKLRSRAATACAHSAVDPKIKGFGHRGSCIHLDIANKHLHSHTSRRFTNGSLERGASSGSYHRITKIRIKVADSHRFNSKEDDMAIFLKLFQRELRFSKIPDSQWVAYLIGALPSDIATLITRESDDEAQDYVHVKEMLLRRFKVCRKNQTTLSST